MLPEPATRRKLGEGFCDHRITRTEHTGGKRMASPFYTAEHESYREVVRRFVEKEIEPYAHEWDEAGGFPRGLFEKTAPNRLLGLGFPAEYSGTAAKKFLLDTAGHGLSPADARGVTA